MIIIARYDYCEPAQKWRARCLLLAITLLLAATITSQAAAQGKDPRYEIVQETKTAHIWIIGGYGFELCRILTDTPQNIPQMQAIGKLCGQATLDMVTSGAAWLYYAGSYNYQAEVKRPLPDIQITSDYNSGQVIITASDPLPGSQVSRIEANINGSPAVCDDYNGQRAAGSQALTCHFPVYNKPVYVTAFALATNGDQSKVIELRIANKVVIGDNAYTKYNTEMDIMLAWGVVPDSDNRPWALENAGAGELVTSHSYYYLAGQILLAGEMSGHNCPGFGLNGNYATQCGLDAAWELVYKYQNAYNDEIAAAAAAWGVPSRLIKQVIAIESQFYPGAIGPVDEKGLYQLTRDGADTLFRWNGPYYVMICNLYFDKCSRLGYDNLAAWQQDLLISHVLSDPNNIDTLAATLRANAYQVARLLDNIAGISQPGDNFTYLEMWKITAANYHAGANLTYAALYRIHEQGQADNYTNYAKALADLQPGALDYISGVYSYKGKGQAVYLPGPGDYWDLPPVSLR